MLRFVLPVKQEDVLRLVLPVKEEGVFGTVGMSAVCFALVSETPPSPFMSANPHTMVRIGSLAYLCRSLQCF